MVGPPYNGHVAKGTLRSVTGRRASSSNSHRCEQALELRRTNEFQRHGGHRQHRCLRGRPRQSPAGLQSQGGGFLAVGCWLCPHLLYLFLSWMVGVVVVLHSVFWD